MIQPEVIEAEGDLPAEPEEQKRLPRDADLLGNRNSLCRKYLAKKIDAIVRGFEEQASRSDDLDKWWNIYNCELDDNQFYNGNAEVYVPIIRDAINARATRFANQLFPQSGRFVDVTSTDGQIPYEIVALINHYIRRQKLKTQVVKPMLINGDVEGQYNLYIDWNWVSRQIVSRETVGVTVEGIETSPGESGPGEEIEDISEEDIEDGCPAFEVLHDSDVLLLPATCDSIELGLSKGGSATIVRRWSKDTLEQMTDDGEIRDQGDAESVRQIDRSMAGLSDVAKTLAKSVGIRAKGPHTLVFESWVMVPLSDKGSFSEKGTPRLCRLWWGVDKEPLGLKRNPYWNDRCPLLSWPVQKIAGLQKGKSQVEHLAPLQYEANDAANERADADHYGAMPIIARKPGEGNAPLILNLAAVWDIDPNDVKFMAFPDLSQRANARIMAATQVIFQSLGVNPSMLPQQSGRPGSKRNQAEIAMEQQVDLLTTAEAVDVVTAGLNEAVEWMVDLDHQFRDRNMTVRAFGEMGIRAEMIDVGPLRNRTQYEFSWCGAEQAKLNVAMQQQGTAFINVLRGMRQDIEAEGFKLRLGPMLERASINIFGPVVGSLMLQDIRHQLSVEPKLENELLADGHSVPVHPLDPDQEHLQAHQQAMQMMGGDPHGTFRVHIQEHLMSMAIKNRAQMMAMAQPGAQGVPGGAGPGVAGTPRQPQGGAQPAGPRQMKGPPGMVRPDNMPGAGGLTMPRRT